MKRAGLATVVLSIIMAGAAFVTMTAADTASVKTTSGLISGVSNSGVTAYLGIPYAAPPVGDLRWRAPEPAPKWDGVRKADHYGASCIQNVAGLGLPWTAEFMPEENTISEDCLFLNVWTTAKSGRERMPVVFYIHGGGYNLNSGSVAVHNGAQLAPKGVVVVSVNYRLGVLGFFTHPALSAESGHHSSGNYGLLDLVAALQWVNRNIAAFGGDPGNVTLVGQSAGGGAVVFLMRSPLAKGLFVRGVAESGPGLLQANGVLLAPAIADKEQAGVKYAESRNATTLAELRALPAMSFVAPAGGGRAAGAAGAPPPPNPRGPVNDEWMITSHPLSKQVPLIVGMVADDIGVGSAQIRTVAAHEADARTQFGDKASAFLALYPASTDAAVAGVRKMYTRDRSRVSIDLWSADQAKLSPVVYTYFFDRPIPWPAHPEYGTFHTSDVPYIFRTLKVIDRPWEPVDFQVSELISTYWTNFAKTGKPNGSGVPNWPAYRADSHTTMEIGAHTAPMPVADPAKLEFLLREVFNRSN